MARTGSTATFTFTSPGSATLTNTPELTFKAFAPGVKPVSYKLERMPAVRCDSVPSISGKSGGCVHPAAPPTFTLSRQDRQVSEAALRVFDAQRKLAGDPGLFGQGKPLHRTMDKKLIAENRGAAWPKRLPRPPGKSCDEFPFASIKEGGASGNYSRRMINAKHNIEADGSKYLLKAYRDHRILNGDAFWVNVT
ncbi:NucA/NucB deoxyribonuclease domain-containing protein [Streptomyces sp. NPDC048442]|uniref:NucA/NucB deoxyribonuclease domain-containing protein n=1 Tax=Streptomyces sp. NPDC048442 TaxID=3154823 RepID=UPI0034152395